MADAVEKIRIAEGNVLSARVNLAANILEHHGARHDAKDSLVNRHDRAVTAKMLTASAGLCRADQSIAIAGNQQVRILFDRRQVAAIGHFERQPVDGDEW